jgi:hyperosmotically inducible periplasmic protein
VRTGGFVVGLVYAWLAVLVIPFITPGVTMKNQLSGRFPAHPRLRTSVLVANALALAMALSACGKPDDGKTAGQKLDSALAKTEQAGEQAKAKTESALAKAEEAVKDATQKTEDSGIAAAGKAGDKLDDMTITAAVSSSLGKDPDLSALKINVDTKNGAVTLNGTAPSQAAVDKASTIAKAIKGVSSVNNKLQVKAS